MNPISSRVATLYSWSGRLVSAAAGVSMTRTVIVGAESELELSLLMLVSLEGVVRSAAETSRLPSTGGPEIDPASFIASSSSDVRGEYRDLVSAFMMSISVR